MEQFDNKFEEFYKLFEARKQNLKNDNDGHHNKEYLNKYEKILNEPEMKVVQEQLAKLGSKYNFKCDILMDGLYSNQDYRLHESHCVGPFKVVSFDAHFSFLENKIFSNVYDITKEIVKEKIKILSGSNVNNFTFVNSRMILPLFRCGKCNHFDAPYNKDDDTKSLVFDENKDFVHKEIDFYENKTVDKNIKLNSFGLMNFEIYNCVNCKNKLVPDTQTEMFYAISRANVSQELLNISSSGGGSISIVTQHAKLEKV